ncbi:MAG: ATP-binding protein [Bacteroidales bacterium]|nr:ATP-binding protein [Bacteroidales bacterium]
MNPFIISAYYGPDYFCDREKETERLIGAVVNGRNMVVSSLRRMGKTGLIKHFLHQLPADEFFLVYVDIDQTDSLNDLVKVLINSLIKIKQQSFSERIIDFIKQFHPVISFHPVTGLPEVEFRQTGASQPETSLVAVLEHLEKLERPVVVAVDEFQRINAYPDNRTEAFLRSIIQHLHNVRFIFSGSSRNILLSMFGDHSRPFYQSADFLSLERLDPIIYQEFILHHFTATGRTIGTDDIADCIAWTDNHTFYSQYLFNTIWGSGSSVIDAETIREIKENILSSRESMYLNYRNLLTGNQYQLLKAIALEGGAEHPNSIEFIRKYNLGSASTVNSALKTMMEKEMIYFESGRYKLYDVFQFHWFRKMTG